MNGNSVETQEVHIGGDLNLGRQSEGGGKGAIWVKWRGKWQAGIQCSMEDCPSSTMKAMPTYGRKKYIVVFFPSTRSFVWADLQLVYPITDNPEPLAFGSHERGREAVKDLNAAKQYMMRRLTAAMLDISDCLPLQAVVESARGVSVWKEFAKEAALAVKYSELGVMLAKLKGMILPVYLNESWMSNRFEEWKQQSETAGTAGFLEKLIKELRNAVCWDEVGKMWDQSEQAKLDSEWKTWKEEAQHHRPNIGRSRQIATPSTSSHSGISGSRKHSSQVFRYYGLGDKGAQSFEAENSSLEPGRKRSKHVHAARLAMEEASLETDNTALKSSTEEQGNEDTRGQFTGLVSLSSGANIEMVHLSAGCSHVMDLTSPNTLRHSSTAGMVESGLVTPKLQNLNSEPKKSNCSSVRCSAFSERKGRQCNKFASDGAIYCCKHQPSSDVHDRKPNKHLSFSLTTSGVDPVICSGMTKYGRRCTHKAKDGSSFCLKHLLQDAANCSGGADVRNSVLQGASSPTVSSRMESKPDTLEAQNLDSQKVQGASSRKRKYDWDSMGQHGWLNSRPQESVKVINRTMQRAASWTRCIGWCRGSGGQCSHRAKPGFSHCEKHLPGSFGYRGRSQEKYVSKEVFQAGLAGNSTHAQEKDILRARDLLHEYMKACLPDGTGREGQRSRQKVREWILSEASKDNRAAEALYNLVTAEKESLEKILNEDSTEQVNGAIVPYEPKLVDCAGLSVSKLGSSGMEQPSPTVCFATPVITPCNGQKQRFRCKLCPQEFVNLDDLGQHWRACHRKEARQLFRGYACLHCGSPFTNKKGLERHWNAQHAGIPFLANSLLVALCIICSGQFADFEDLWQHVMYSHSDCLSIATAVVKGDSLVLFSEHSSTGLEVINAIGCSNCNQTFATYSDLHQHEENMHKQFHHSAGGSQVEGDSSVPPGSVNKFKCKICGLRFRLLPDLGRHHQAEHKPVQAMQLKMGKEDGNGMGLYGEPSSNMGIEKEKNRIQKLDVRRANRSSQLGIETKSSEQHQYDQDLVEIEGHKGPKIPGCPTNNDILVVARFSCCRNKLLSILDKKYATLPERLSLKAAKLCSEANVKLQWHRDEYACPNGCREYALSPDVRPATLPNSFPRANFVPFQLTAPPVADYKERSESGGILLDENHLVHTAPIQTAEVKYFVLCKDISSGQEGVPIPCIVDLNVMEPCNCALCVDTCGNYADSLSPWTNFSYVTKRLLDPSLGLDTKSSQLGCVCQESQCLPERCDHVYLFDNDNTDALDIYGQPMCGRFPYDKQGHIILEEGFLVYECNAICNCQEDCQNRVLQKGVRVKLEVYKTKHKGWAVRAAQPIARGTFVCEYIGEVLNDREANKRGERYDKEGCSYLYDIDAHIDTALLGRTKPFVIDATRYGNVARFINHSCSPNLVNYQVLVESMDCQLAHIGLYASRDIDVGEELAYDYRYKLLPGKGCPCHCGATNCRGRLY